MEFSTISAILRGRWLINKAFADTQMPLVLRMVNGERVDFGMNKMYHDDDDDSDHEAKLPQPKKLAAARNVYSVRAYTDLSKLPDGSICMLTLAGPLLKRGDYCSYGMVDHAELINRLTAASNVSAILLNIDSPGGQADGTAMLADVIKAAGNVKPVVAMIDDGMAASAAIWVASAANEIYVTQVTDQVGSVGVYTTIADWNAHYKDYFKLPVQDVYAPQSTDKNADYREAINGNIEPLQEELAVLANQFINTVATNRAGKIKGDSWKTGKMFYAKDAIKIGLIDGIKSFADVVKRMNTLINKSSNNSNNNTMAFQKTLAVAKAESFAVTDEGFVLTEDQLNNVEAALTGEAETTNTEALEQANASIVDLTVARDTALAEAGAATENLNAANATIVTRNARITELEGQLAEFTGKASGDGSVVENEGGDPAPAKAKETKVASLKPEHPANVAAKAKVEAAKAKRNFKRR